MGHMEHLAAPAAEKYPAGQRVSQDVDRVSGAARPAEQFVQVVAPTSFAYFPAAQLKHDVLAPNPATPYVPLGQVVHMLLSVS